jgi:hypothetical protein
MLATLLLAAVIGLPAGQEKKVDDPPPPMPLEVFSRDDAYRQKDGKVQDFHGTLKRHGTSKEIPGFSGSSPYSLEYTTYQTVTALIKIGDKIVPEMRVVAIAESKEVYVGRKDNLLDRFVGKQVKVVGKVITREKDGKKYLEIWPARIEVENPKDVVPLPSKVVQAPKVGQFKLPSPEDECCADDKDAQPGGADAKLLKIQASAPIPLAGKNKHSIIRSAKELLAAQGGKDAGDEAEKAATAKLAKALKLEAIDWSKQMVIGINGGTRPTGGYSVEVISATVQNNKLTIYWKLNTPKPGQPVTQALTHPAQTVVIDRYEGPVEFNPAMPPGAVKKDR